MLSSSGNVADISSKRRLARQKRRRRILLVPALILLFLVLCWGFKSLAGCLVDVVQVQPSGLEDILAADFIVIREEKAVSIPYAGQIELLHREGERVAKDTVIAYLIKERGTSLEGTDKIPLIAPQAGVLSFTTDGLENILSPQSWNQLDVSKLPGLQKGLDNQAGGDAKEKKSVTAGEFLFKITDNLAPSYLYLETDKDIPAGLFIKGHNLDIKLGQPDESIQGLITELSTESKITRMLLKITTYAGLEKTRKLSAAIITNKYNGLVVPEQTLEIKDQKTGVYLLQKGKAVWRQVNVTGRSQKMAAVEGLEPGEWVIATPQLVREGQRVFSLRH